MTPRSWLFVPGDCPERMEKALRSGAGALVLDLEDSVAEPAKPAARTLVRQFLGHRPASAPQLWVRINPVGSRHMAADLAGVLPGRPDGIVLPKSESADHVRAVAACMETAAARILPITTETPRAIFRLDSYAGACDRLAGLSWGAEDLSAAVGASSARDEGGALRPLCELARSLCLAGAAAAGVAAVETVYPNFRDLAGLTACADRARRDGFAGMMAIHPCQVATINLAFTPSPDEVERARRIVALFAEDPGAGVLSLDGTMLDAVHLKQAHRTLDRIQDGEI